MSERDRYRDRNLVFFISDPHYLNCFSTSREGLLLAVGLNIKSVALVSGQRD